MESIGVLGFIGVGIAWRQLRWLPDADTVRRMVASAVFYGFLPVLTFRSMLHAPVESVLWKVPLVATVSMVITLLGAWLLVRNYPLDGRRRAALLLAATFGNVTYLGIPVLTMTIGAEHTFVAVLYDFAASTPLLWTLGIGVALAVAAGNGLVAPIGRRIGALPPLWAAAAGLALQLGGYSLPEPLDQMAGLISALVIPMMMFVFGLSLRWEYLRQWREFVGVGILKLFLAPAVALALALALGLDKPTATATVLEAAMPTMMLVLVVAERFGLDSEAVAAAIALTTVASAGTLPLWWWAMSMVW